MKNDFPRIIANLRPEAVNRRQFLQSAVGASMAIAATSHAQTRHHIAPNALVRVGLIGHDGHSEIILNSLPSLSNVQWTAYAKGEPGEDSAWAQKQIPGGSPVRVYENYHDMLEEEQLDVVGVCLPFFQNAEASIQAAHKGIHVLSEKPAALNLPDLGRLEKVINESGVGYSIMLAMRALPIFQAARKAVQEGTIGEPILLSSQKSYQFGSQRAWYYNERKTYGGTIPWVGIHSRDRNTPMLPHSRATRHTPKLRDVRTTPACCSASPMAARPHATWISCGQRALPPTAMIASALPAAREFWKLTIRTIV
jgi:predicted dehydrogenase